MESLLFRLEKQCLIKWKYEYLQKVFDSRFWQLLHDEETVNVMTIYLSVCTHTSQVNFYYHGKIFIFSSKNFLSIFIFQQFSLYCAKYYVNSHHLKNCFAPLACHLSAFLLFFLIIESFLGSGSLVFFCETQHRLYLIV